MSARLYTTVYAPDDLPTEEAHIVSKSLGTVNVWSELVYTTALHGTGGLVGKINRHHPDAALLQKDRYVIVHSDAGPVGGAFLDEGTIDLSAEEGKGDEWATWTGKGQIYVLDRANMDSTSNITGGHNPIDGFWDLDEQGPLAGNENAHPIPMAKRVIVEAQLNTPNAIDMVDHSSWDYDSDSAAAVVPFVTGDFGADVGESLYELFAQMSQIGGVVWQMSYLFALNAYLTFGTDRSGAFASDTVRFEKGVNVITKIQRQVRGSVHKTHLIVGGAERTFVTVTDPDYVSGDVVRWGFLSVPESSATDVLEAVGLAHIELRKRQTDVWTFPLHDHGDDPANGIYEPAPDIADGHFWVGDTASIHTGTGEYDANEEAAPVAAITWQLKTGAEANGDYQIIVEIGSTLHWDGAKVLSGATPGSQHRVNICRDTTTAGSCIDTYTRTESAGSWGTGELGLWTKQEGIDALISVDGSRGLISAAWDGVAGDIIPSALTLDHPMSLPIEVLFTVRSLADRPSGDEPFIWVMLDQGDYYAAGTAPPQAFAGLRFNRDSSATDVTYYMVNYPTTGAFQSWDGDGDVAPHLGERVAFDADDVDIRVRVRFQTDRILMNAWLASEAEPEGWHETFITTTYPTPPNTLPEDWQRIGVYAYSGTDFVPNDPDMSWQIDDFEIVEPCDAGGTSTCIHGGPNATSGDAETECGQCLAPGNHEHDYVAAGGTTGQVLKKASDDDWNTEWGDETAAAPTDATYLVTTAHAGLSAEVAVGTTPGGELGGTWASPTVDATHAGSTHLVLGTTAGTAAEGDHTHEPLHNYAAVAAPTATDDSGAGYGVGSVWVDTSTDTGYMCMDATATAAVWKQITA